MSDTYEFLKAQKDAIVAKQDAELAEWLTAASEDIAHYRKQLAEAKAKIESLQAAQTEAADALQALERVPMTDREIAGAWIKLADPVAFGSKFQNDSQVREFTRAIEAHHGITPPEIKEKTL